MWKFPVNQFDWNFCLKWDLSSELNKNKQKIYISQQYLLRLVYVLITLILIRVCLSLSSPHVYMNSHPVFFAGSLFFLSSMSTHSHHDQHM